MAQVRLSEEARDDFHDLDGSAKKVVARALKKLETDPHLRGEPLGSRARGNLTTFRKLRAGRNNDFRIVYRIESDESVVVVWVIALRSDSEAYELAVSRLRMHENPTVRNLAVSLDEMWDTR
jgi:mRNA interferase RelE/StbE